MGFAKRDIWKLFYTILILSVVFIIVTSYLLWEVKKEDYKERQETQVTSTSYYLEDLFWQYETILDIIGENILADNGTIRKNPKLLDQILSLNPTLACFRIYAPNGEVIFASSNIGGETPNIFQTIKSDYFKKTLHSDSMVIGRTYYMYKMHDLIIPLRKALRDKSGKVIAVIASAMRLNKQSKFVRLLLQQNHTWLLKDRTYYIQFYNFDSKTYAKPVPKERIEKALEIVQKNYATSLKEIKDRSKTVTFVYKSYLTGQISLTSCKFIKRYDLWVVASTPLSAIKDDFLEEETVILLSYIFIMLFIYYLVDVIDKNEMQKEKTLKTQAVTDSLTKLHNRLYIEEKIKNYPLEYTLFFIDLDGFKNINDSFGHEYGDKVLQVISERLVELAEENKRELIRYSGDEFIFVTEFMSDAQIQEFAHRILSHISDEIIIDEFRLLLGASIGVARYPDDGKNFDEVKRYADLAMYKAKEVKNSYTIFHASLKEEFLKTALMEQELKLALERNEFSLVYQPQVYSDGELHGVETLIRWHNEKLGDVSPAQFVPVAEAMGIIKDIGRFVIDKALEEMYALQQEIQKDFHLSINVSAKQFAQHDFLSCFIGKVGASPIKNEYIGVEITETAFIEDEKRVRHILEDLRRQGMLVSLDDFGTGYSSMAILRNLPIDELKIDKSFIDDIAEDVNTKQIVYSIIIIAKSLGLKVVAEGVEMLSQKEILDDLGCDIYQGFLFSKPLGKEEFLRVLKENGGVFTSRS